MHLNQFTRWVDKVLLALLAMIMGGCQVLDRSMFAPRTGEIFQTTRMGPAAGAGLYCMVMSMGIWGAQKRGTEWMLPLALVGLPIAVAGFIVDEGIISPLTDLVCLPYDLSQTNHGFYIRIVDEYGEPVPGAKLNGRIIYYNFFGDIEFAGETDAAGEFYISKLKNVRGYCWANETPGHTPWHQGRDFEVKNAKPEADGRIVFQFVQAKANPGGWQAKRDLVRTEVLSMLLGKWSADKASRRWLRDGFNCPDANAPDRYCFVLDDSGKATACVPNGYAFHSGIIDDNSRRHGLGHSTWTLVEQGEEKKRWHDSPPKSGWQWAVALLQIRESGRAPSHGLYYLGEDEKGIYLSPGPFDHITKDAVVLKYRKVDK